jgi:hypothetical protein
VKDVLLLLPPLLLQSVLVRVHIYTVCVSRVWTKKHRLAVKQHLLAVKNHRLAIKNHRLAVKQHRLAVKQHRLAVKKHRLAVKRSGFFSGGDIRVIRVLQIEIVKRESCVHTLGARLGDLSDSV